MEGHDWQFNGSVISSFGMEAWHQENQNWIGSNYFYEEEQIMSNSSDHVLHYFSTILTTNLPSGLELFPSGTGTESYIDLYNSSDSSNTSRISIDLTGAVASITSATFGTGTAVTHLAIGDANMKALYSYKNTLDDGTGAIIAVGTGTFSGLLTANAGVSSTTLALSSNVTKVNGVTTAGAVGVMTVVGSLRNTAYNANGAFLTVSAPSSGQYAIFVYGYVIDTTMTVTLTYYDESGQSITTGTLGTTSSTTESSLVNGYTFSAESGKNIVINVNSGGNSAVVGAAIVFIG